MTGDTLLIILVLAAAAGAVLAAFLAALQVRAVRSELTASREQHTREQAEAAAAMSSQVGEAVGRLHTRLGELGLQMSESVARQMAVSQRTLGEGIEGATKVFGSVRQQLGQVAEMAARMEKLGRSIEELEGILKVPKLRGLFGERALEELLRQGLPVGVWEAQYRFSDGRTVDAVVRVGERMVPVDAKFPLEAYRRMAGAADEAGQRAAARELAASVKRRVDEIAERYIRPGEGTYEFALMFVPAEAVYAELAGGEGATAGLVDYALARRVLPVSPSTLYAYLSTVSTGLRGLEVEANAAEIIRGIGEVEQQLARFVDEFGVLGKHLTNAVAKFGDAQRRLSAVEARLEALQAVGGGETEQP